MATTITKDDLEQKYNTMTNKELCDELGVSKATLIKYLQNAGIEMKGKGNRVQCNRTKVVVI